MDFGLAKLKGSLKLTKTSSTVGTLAYMAPEQIQAGEVDARSDIFSFGVVLYEMLTGHLPFRGEHEAAMVYSIANEDPLPIQKYLPAISAELVHVVNRALEKDPENRYQNVHDMVIDLRRLKKETSRVSRTSEVHSGTLRRETSAPEKKKVIRNVLIVGTVCVVVLAVALLLFLKQSVEPNPNWTMKTLDLPFTEIQYPDLSRDGKWLVFPAADANGKWDIYNMHISGGEPKRITTDSSQYPAVSFSVSISPDGSLVIYNLINPRTDKSEIRIVSSLGGGVPNVIAEIGMTQKWRPDGERIGYMRAPRLNVGSERCPSKSGRSEFWTVRANGTDQKLEFVDTLGIAIAPNFDFDWSPDGKSIAWLRTFEGGTQEIIVHELESGKERQLTFDKKSIDEVCWASNNQIIYSTNKSGSTNLWMLPATGGDAVQITAGEGPDVGMSVSADCKRLVYYRRRTLGYVWRGSLDGSGTKQLTFENRQVGALSFSPDRKEVVFSTGGIDELGSNYGIYIIDHEGQNRRQLVQATNLNSSPIWSPDGKWIAYNSRASGTPPDSSDIFLLDALNPRSLKQMVRGQPRLWIDPRTLVVSRGNRTWFFDILTNEERPFFEDSTIAFPVKGERYVCYFDSRLGKRGYWVVPTSDRTSQQSVEPRLVFSTSEPLGYSVSNDRSWILLWDDSGTAWKLLLPSGKRERVPGTFPGLRRGSAVSISYDGKEILYVQNRLDSKLVVIDNPFK
jgi:Tol biopolymer transport system component